MIRRWARGWPPELPTYGHPDRFGPLRYQGVRLLGRTLERVGAWLEGVSWGWPSRAELEHFRERQGR